MMAKKVTSAKAPAKSAKKKTPTKSANASSADDTAVKKKPVAQKATAPAKIVKSNTKSQGKPTGTALAGSTAAKKPVKKKAGHTDSQWLPGKFIFWEGDSYSCCQVGFISTGPTKRPIAFWKDVVLPPQSVESLQAGVAVEYQISPESLAPKAVRLAQ